MDMVFSDESPSEISDKIKELLQVKALEKIEMIRPQISSNMFALDTESEE